MTDCDNIAACVCIGLGSGAGSVAETESDLHASNILITTSSYTRGRQRSVIIALVIQLHLITICNSNWVTVIAVYNY